MKTIKEMIERFFGILHFSLIVIIWFIILVIGGIICYIVIIPILHISDGKYWKEIT